MPDSIVAAGTGEPVARARDELVRGVAGMLGRDLRAVDAVPAAGGVLLIGTVYDLRRMAPEAGGPLAALLAKAVEGPPGPDAYRIQSSTSGGRSLTVIAGGGDRGVLYGSFAWLRALALGELGPGFSAASTPAASIRWINHWDNIDGTIERGYGGRSIFWEGGALRDDLAAVHDYARLLASLGINGLSVNNVNANTRFIDSSFIPQLATLAGILRPWGIRMGVSVDFASPAKLGGLSTYDPLEPAVAAWWKRKVDELYAAVPDLGGIVLKADSEGRVGPSAYGRTHADAANVIAAALAPHGGIIFYRGFVYDHKMDWRNPKNDRARAAYDNFIHLDGAFRDNVILQIKHGPIDFQVREPASPLFGALKETSQAIELQITQEYFGQGRHTVFLVPMWEEVLDFNMQVRGPFTPVRDIVTGRTWGRGRTSGFVGVSNVGRDPNWYGNHLSQANLYGFGRLAWDPRLSSAAIAGEWTRQTFGHDPAVVETVTRIQLESWPAFENYTGPLGLQTLTDIVGNHYGVAVEASERNGWGQWHRSDAEGAGMDRTVATGTGYIGQYSPGVARVYESLARVPDELILFLHHVPYTHRLRSGKTVIQHLYDAHYEGAETVARWVPEWAALRGRVDAERHAEVLRQLEYQAGHAVVWRDAVNNWFHRTSGIADARGRVGRHPHRVEAEAVSLEGYAHVDVTPWETASGTGAVECKATRCTASVPVTQSPGTYEVIVQYFDVNTGRARYEVQVDGKTVAGWIAADRLPTRRLDGSSSTRHVIGGLALRPGQTIAVTGYPDGEETAALDYLEIVPAR